MQINCDSCTYTLGCTHKLNSTPANSRDMWKTLLKYEVILTAQVSLCIFRHTFPLSKYLQMHGMDILSAQRLIEGTEDSLNTFVRDFEGVKGAADVFVSRVNKKLEEADSELVVETAQKRDGKKAKNAWRAPGR